MGANVFRRLQTQRDVTGIFWQVKGSPLDSVRRLQTPRNSLTRKRSLVQIQYGPRHFSKSCLAPGARMGARLLRFCSISAGHSAGIPVSTQASPAVPVSSERLASKVIAVLACCPVLSDPSQAS
jgi:hypothetical protein